MDIRNQAVMNAEKARIAAVIARHDKIVLQLSGGKDSLACLELLRDHWDKITVIWANAGDPFPETIEQMARIRARVPHFQEVRSDQPVQIESMGWPVDLIPVRNTPYGRMLQSHDEPIMQGWVLCCNSNVWQPMMKAVFDLGATLVIRGMKRIDGRKGPEKPGQVAHGIEFLLPVYEWSHDDVFDYLEREGVELPPHYAYVKTSLDCMLCTACINENVGKMRYLRDRHPKHFGEVQRRLGMIADAVRSELADLEAAIL